MTSPAPMKFHTGPRTRKVLKPGEHPTIKRLGRSPYAGQVPSAPPPPPPQAPTARAPRTATTQVEPPTVNLPPTKQAAPGAKARSGKAPGRLHRMAHSGEVDLNYKGGDERIQKRLAAQQAIAQEKHRLTMERIQARAAANSQGASKRPRNPQLRAAGRVAGIVQRAPKVGTPDLGFLVPASGIFTAGVALIAANYFSQRSFSDFWSTLSKPVTPGQIGFRTGPQAAADLKVLGGQVLFLFVLSGIANLGETGNLFAIGLMASLWLLFFMKNSSLFTTSNSAMGQLVRLMFNLPTLSSAKVLPNAPAPTTQGAIL